MSRISTFPLVMQAIWELSRYDAVTAVGGFERIHQDLIHLGARETVPRPEAERAICDAVGWALSLYWKHVRCLQRSIVAARLLRRNGMRAEVVIGYRSVSIFGHAWVEIGNRVVNDSPCYRRRLCILERA